jgi:hypothetical protein
MQQQQRMADEEQHVTDRRAQRASRPRALVLCLNLAGNALVVAGAAYLLLRRSNLPTFFPHARGASRDDGANDVAMAATMFMLAAAAFYTAQYARRHRSWMRTPAWHRKHGRV